MGQVECCVEESSPGRYLSSVFFLSSRRRHTRLQGDWSSDVCSSDLLIAPHVPALPLDAREAERLAEQALAQKRVGAVGTHAFEALQRVLAGDLRRVGPQRLVVGLRHDELVAETLWIAEQEAVTGSLGARAVLLQALLPEVERLRRP